MVTNAAPRKPPSVIGVTALFAAPSDEGNIRFLTTIPAERAQFLDALFRSHFHLKPFEDYSFGVELESPKLLNSQQAT